MRKVFQNELKEVQNELVALSEMVSVAILNATRAFNGSDVSLAESVIQADSDIDKKSAVVDEMMVGILVRQQPVASDMRLTVSSMRIAHSLERMGDLAEHIALLARYRFPNYTLPKPFDTLFASMADIDVEMASLVTGLLRHHNPETIQKIGNFDDKLDELHASSFRFLLGEAFDGDKANIVDFTLASRYYERFGDHAVSISRRITYLLFGTNS